MSWKPPTALPPQQPKGHASLRIALRGVPTDVNYETAASAVNVGLSLSSYEEHESKNTEQLIKVSGDLSFSPMFWTLVGDYKKGIIETSNEPKASREEYEDFYMRMLAARMFMAGIKWAERGR